MKTIVFEGRELLYERRRYGKTTYTWVCARDKAGKWQELGDPWPCITPAKDEIRAALAIFDAQQAA